MFVKKLILVLSISIYFENIFKMILFLFFLIYSLIIFDNYEELEDKKGTKLSVREYKKRMEAESKRLNQKLDDMVKEYNTLAEQYNKLLDEKAELERKNRQKAYDVLNQQEYIK